MSPQNKIRTALSEKIRPLAPLAKGGRAAPQAWRGDSSTQGPVQQKISGRRRFSTTNPPTALPHIDRFSIEEGALRRIPPPPLRGGPPPFNKGGKRIARPCQTAALSAHFNTQNAPPSGGAFLIQSSSPKNFSWTARTAATASFSSMSTETRISLVLII